MGVIGISSLAVRLGLARLPQGVGWAELYGVSIPCGMEEDRRLGDAVLRENLIERVFVYHRWQQLMLNGLTAHKLVEFHADHK